MKPTANNNLDLKALWGPALYEIEESLKGALENIKIALTTAPWQEGENHITLYHGEGSPGLNLTVFDDETEVIARFNTPLDVFLDETEEVYSCGDNGWGQEMIDDLEIFKAKIQERIDRMKAEIALEDQP